MLSPTALSGRGDRRHTGWSGHPAAFVPAGLADGLRVGMRIMGRRGADGDVLASGAGFERLRPWSYDIPAWRVLA